MQQEVSSPGTYGDGLKPAISVEGAKDEDPVYEDSGRGPGVVDPVALSVSMTLYQAVSLAITPRTTFSVGFAPPTTVVGARIFCGNKVVSQGDLVMMDCAHRLARVAHGFNVHLEVRYENSDTVVWSSNNPDIWCGDGGIQPLVRHCGEFTARSPITRKGAVSGKSKEPGKMGRPPGSKNKPKQHASAVAKKSRSKKRIGRPPGSKDKAPRKRSGK